MPITDVNELKEFLENKALNEKDEKGRLIKEILSYQEMNNIIREYDFVPCIEHYQDGHLFNGSILWTWNVGNLNLMSIDEIRALARRAKSWDKFIHHFVSAKRKGMDL